MTMREHGQPPAWLAAVMAGAAEDAAFVSSWDSEFPKDGGHALRAQPEGEPSLPQNSRGTGHHGRLTLAWHAANEAAASHEEDRRPPSRPAAAAGRPRSPSPAAGHAPHRSTVLRQQPHGTMPAAAPSARGASAAPAADLQQSAAPTAAFVPSERSLGAAWAAARMAREVGSEAAADRRSTKVLGLLTPAPGPEQYQSLRQWAPASGNREQRARAAGQGGAIVPWTGAPSADPGGADHGVSLAALTTSAPTGAAHGRGRHGGGGRRRAERDGRGGGRRGGADDGGAG